MSFELVYVGVWFYLSCTDSSLYVFVHVYPIHICILATVEKIATQYNATSAGSVEEKWNDDA